MSRFKFTRYIPSPLEDLDFADLVNKLQDFFLESGFGTQFSPGQQAAQSREGLLYALAEVLKDDEALPDEWRVELQEFVEDFPDRELSGEVQEFLNQVLEQLLQQGFIRETESGEPFTGQGENGEVGVPDSYVEYELAGKGVDLLGYQTLKSLLGSLGRSRFGQHDSDRLATGVGSDAASRPYEFGDTLNLDIPATLLNSVRRAGLQIPLDLDYQDLRVHQTEDTNSCATVLMLDCSHSMILYGEDRFTPAKKVALALAHLIRTRFPGDSVDVVLFHDSAESIPLAKLASVKVGPYHTNTCEGLKLARRILRNRRKEMRQIIMITDGKPSAMTLPGGRIYKNSFGLDPMILRETFREVRNCSRWGITINTFMVAQDYYLVEFVRRVARMSHGKAYFTTTLNLANYILLDFVGGKSKRVH